MSERHTVETEVKLAVPDSRTLARLRRLREIPGFTVREAHEVRLTDTFKDTVEFRLLRAGLALRERRAGDRWLITVKGVVNADARFHRREEVEQDSAGPIGEFVDPSSPVGRRIAPILEGEPLSTLFSFSQIRVSRPIERRGRRIADLSLDEITMSSDQRSAEFFEVEIEAASERGVKSLPGIGRWFADAFALPTVRRTKFERAVEFFGTPVPDIRLDEASGLRPEMDFTAALGRLLEEQLGEITRNRELILEHPRVAAVHDMRVAAQRARTLLAIAPPGSLDSKAIEGFLKALRTRLGVVRDLQVLPKTMDRVIARLGERPRSVGVLRKRAREAERAESRALQDHLRSKWYHRGLEKLLSSPPQLDRPDYRRAPRELRDALPPVLLHRMSLVDSFHRSLRPCAGEAYHELRKLMKKVRYVLEFFEPVLGETGRRLRSAAVDVQNPLGVMQDSVVARRISDELAVTDSALDEGFSAVATAQEEAFAEAWARFCDPRLRHEVFEELMQL